MVLSFKEILELTYVLFPQLRVSLLKPPEIPISSVFNVWPSQLIPEFAPILPLFFAGSTFHLVAAVLPGVFPNKAFHFSWFIFCLLQFKGYVSHLVSLKKFAGPGLIFGPLIYGPAYIREEVIRYPDD